jgi:hypothetical protein
MAIDHRIGNKVIKNARREEATGTRVDPYPYIGIVKNNLDPTRSGRLQVFIPDLGGPPDDPKNWRTVSYASPFQGYTSQTQASTDRPSVDNKFTTVHHTYGMWMVPPDIGVEVIVMFIAGDPMRGYWIACVSSHLSHYMVPGLASTPNVDPSSMSAEDRQTYTPGDIVPVVEFNEYTKDFTNLSFYNNNKPIHSIQYNILKNQGLHKDKIRGIISSSSQRESPSHVFGISTPGRPLDDPADSAKKYLDDLNNNKLDPKYKTIKSRKGGHSFVMDDGATLGEDQLIRLRTAGGHQILMHDTNSTIYIGHSDGVSWIEMASDGSISMFANGTYNLRSVGTMNLHSDKDINFNAVGSINLNAGNNFKVNSTNTEFLQGQFRSESTIKTEFKTGTFNIDGSAKVSVKAGGILALEGSGIYQNSGKTNTVKQVKPIQNNKLAEAVESGSVWTSQPGRLNSIVTVAPTHEPFQRSTSGVFFTPKGTGIQPATTYQAKVDATKTTSTDGVQNPAGDKELRTQPPCDCTIGNLTADQMTAYFAQIGKSESGGNYQAVNTIGYVGKYQFGYPALIDGGYAKSSVKSNRQLTNPNSWTGKDGIESLEDWLNNPDVQEAAMCAYTKRNYKTMCRIGAISSEQAPEDVAGMLAVSHLLGPGGAKKYRNGESQSDAYGTTGSAYFNKGKYAVAVLAPKIPAINVG